MKFEGRTEFAGAVLAVQDEQLMIYFPDGEGTSEPLTESVVQKLHSFALCAQLHLSEVNRGESR